MSIRLHRSLGPISLAHNSQITHVSENSISELKSGKIGTANDMTLISEIFSSTRQPYNPKTIMFRSQS